MRRNKNEKYPITGKSTYELITKIERFIYSKPIDENESIFFEDLMNILKEIANESQEISHNTALHKILSYLVYEDFYLMTYDDLDWIDNIYDFKNYVIEIFKEINFNIPSEFLSEDENVIYEARDTYRSYFLEGLQVFVNSAFACLWYRKAFLYDFNELMASLLDYKMERVYFPKWLTDSLIFRERGLCHYCQAPVVNPNLTNQTYDIDHVIPLDQKGTNDPTNLVLSCSPCNNQKRANLIFIPDTFSWPNIQNNEILYKK